MSQRSRTSRVRGHVHCDSCYSRRCRARVEVSVCCAVIPCRLLCGAVFHLCKEEDHLLLCPNVRVPCLNAEYGCPLHLPRSSQAAHLQVCPASVVCCSMEWNRWPVNDAHSYPTTELYENLIKEREQGGWLDFTVALKDQDVLFHSMKMKKLFPELIQSVEEEEKEEERREEEKRKEKQRQRKEAAERAAMEASGQTWKSFVMFDVQQGPEEKEESESDDDIEYQQELTQEEREALARETGVQANLLENYNAWERMFTMEMGGCREAGEGAVTGRGRGQSKGNGKGLDTLTEEDAADTCVGATASNTCKQGSSACVAASTSSSSCLAETLKKKKFEYGSVEPMKIITVRTFKAPTSFAARQGRIRNPGFYKRESKAVDTSDLGLALQQMPVWEEVQASLLCSLEKEQRGHLIAESVCTDGLLQDEGTQTYSFLSAPFRRNTSLADLTTAKPLELHLQLQVESVTSRHHKASSAFTFLCGHTFQRREYGKHYKNIHSDIQMSVNGWFEQRCPLAYLGCTYSQRRLQPSTHEATVSYNEDLGCFSMRPTLPVSLGDASQASQRKGGGRGGGGEDSLSSLPYEVLCHMASFLDSLSLSQLALVSKLMRQVCSTLLQERGMVTLCWERQKNSQGRAQWRVTQTVWQFSTLFSSVDTWCFQNTPSMSEHLKVCPCYERESRTEKIRLPRIRTEVQTKTSCKGPTLVSLFQQKRIMM
ncbi:F-box only protein 40-like [Epinephelus moara]|uniref:F-box only protein 40-like n=1 Tax=Epinephelus moara TaxID=300413 RepID=UPI00214F5D78|nr:F-box only protein 40-like [Epinephelus moara]XP_049897139.1 F-box only protein 40-like [Epinephelus moara]XP_049897140.1 F-box only protein 40-like [Epinephelus moara]